MVLVKKRDGRNEEFVQEKIVVSLIKSGAPAGFARTIAQDIERSARDSITTQEIRTSALGRLRAKNPAWERNWIVYDAAVKKRTDE
jgi:transcriptional regulator NrdR family protein